MDGERNVALHEGSSSESAQTKNRLSVRQTLMVGIALFTMFFGAGNLIFPPLLGYQAGDATVPAFAGFVISAIGIPVLGVVAVAKAGELPRLAAHVGPRFSKAFTLLVVLAIGPLLAIPRTASTSFAMVVSPFIPSGDLLVPQVLYSLVFFIVAFLLAKNPNHITAFLGKASGPVLLVLVAVLVGGAVLTPAPAPTATASATYASLPFAAGFLEGYQTMDALAALLFGIVIALNIQSMGVTRVNDVARITSTAGIIMGVVEALVYSGLAYVGIWASGLIPAEQQGVTGATVLAAAAQALFGDVGVGIIGVIFILACLNVCCSLLCTVSEHFNLEFPRFSYEIWLIIFTIASFAFANVGLAAIISISVPVLEALYPIAIVLIIMGVAHRVIDRKPLLWKSVVFCTACASITLTATSIFWPATESGSPLAFIPFADIGLGWIIPALLGAGIGIFADSHVTRSAIEGNDEPLSR